MDIFLVNKDDPHAGSLCKKLASAKPGEFVKLSTEEFNLHDSEDFRYINYGNSANANTSNLNILECDKTKSYIFVCDEMTAIDDVIITIENLGLDAGIIRRKSYA